MWSFQAGAGSATFGVQVQPAWEGWAFSNLDAQLTIYEALGKVLGTPANPAGTYYVAVAGTGSGDPKDGTSYSSYGSRGQFSLSASFPAAPTQQDPPSPSPSTDAGPPPSPTPDGSTAEDPADQQEQVLQSPSPEPNQHSKSDDTPVQLALLSQFPAGVQPRFTPALWAVSARDVCLRELSAQVGVNGVAVATPYDAGRCSSAVLPGAYTLASGDAPDGLQLGRWQCFDITDGFLYGPVSGEVVTLEPASVVSCVAVFEEDYAPGLLLDPSPP
ncbi:hypothetical protein COO60DRAFT_1640850 [Scenedesmus sp. NREL 46B-D3]|nr:hypothetical protein COO60DRAFT_1640850 [Scenedesmus sp. NREL 46B-D3]